MPLFVGRGDSRRRPRESGRLAMKAPHCGVLPFGVVSRSGMGDGGYAFSTACDKAGKVVGVWIVFVDDEGQG